MRVLKKKCLKKLEELGEEATFSRHRRASVENSVLKVTKYVCCSTQISANGVAGWGGEGGSVNRG